MYLHETPIPLAEKPMGVEVSVERDLSEHGLPRLRGIIDLVSAEGVIVDYKSCATTPNAVSLAEEVPVRASFLDIRGH